MNDDLPIEEWLQDPNGNANDSWIDLIYQHYQSGDHWIQAGIKFDGCIHLRKAYNIPFPKIDKNQDYIHICDIDEYISMLIKLRDRASKHFGDE